MRFRPYSSDEYVPLMGCLDIKLTNEEGKHIPTRVYVTKGQRESLLRKEDATKLGILKINRRGDPPDEVVERNSRTRTASTARTHSRSPEPMRCITPEI